MTPSGIGSLVFMDDVIVDRSSRINSKVNSSGLFFSLRLKLIRQLHR